MKVLLLGGTREARELAQVRRQDALELPERSIAYGTGLAHRHDCLAALAMHGL